MLLEIKNLNITYAVKGKPSFALKDFSLSLNQGEILGIVGESGSGKTTLAKAILGLLPQNSNIKSGEIRFKETELTKLGERQWKKIRGSEMSMIFQNPATALNPGRKIAKQFYDISKENKNNNEKIIESLRQAHLPNPEEILNKYPYELSGGMKQRVAIAMAISLNPKLLIADEPTSGIDAFNRGNIMQELVELREKKGIGILIISHNIEELSRIADKILVLYKGQGVEYEKSEEVMKKPSHEYTKRLIGAIGS